MDTFFTISDIFLFIDYSCVILLQVWQFDSKFPEFTAGSSPWFGQTGTDRGADQSTIDWNQSSRGCGQQTGQTFRSYSNPDSICKKLKMHVRKLACHPPSTFDYSEVLYPRHFEGVLHLSFFPEIFTVSSKTPQLSSR